MATKFILHGGNVSGSPDNGLALFKEAFTSNKPTLKVLDCLFARSQTDWAESFEQHKQFWFGCVPGVLLEVELATVEKFPEQLRATDVVYFVGGIDQVLLEGLGGSLTRDAVENKVVIGSSAGADILCRYFYNLDTLRIEGGTGLVPIKFIPHYRSDYNAPNIDWDKAEAELKAYKEDLPLLTLQEGEFKVFQQ